MPRLPSTLATVLQDLQPIDPPLETEPFLSAFPKGLDQHVADLRSGILSASMTQGVDATTVLAVMDHLSGDCVSPDGSDKLFALLKDRPTITLRDIWSVQLFKDHVNELTKTMTEGWPTRDTWIPVCDVGELPRNDDKRGLKTLDGTLLTQITGTQRKRNAEYFKVGFGHQLLNRLAQGIVSMTNGGMHKATGLIVPDELKPFWSALSLIEDSEAPSETSRQAVPVTARLPPGCIQDNPRAAATSFDAKYTYELQCGPDGLQPETSTKRLRSSNTEPRVTITLGDYDTLHYSGLMDVILEFGCDTTGTEAEGGLPRSRMQVGHRRQYEKAGRAAQAASSLAWAYSLLSGAGTTPTDDNFESYLLAARQVARISKAQITRARHDSDGMDWNDPRLLSEGLPAYRVNGALESLWPTDRAETRTHLRDTMTSGRDGEFVGFVKTLALARYALASVTNEVDDWSKSLDQEPGSIELGSQKEKLKKGLQACEDTLRGLLGSKAAILDG